MRESKACAAQSVALAHRVAGRQRLRPRRFRNNRHSRRSPSVIRVRHPEQTGQIEQRQAAKRQRFRSDSVQLVRISVCHRSRVDMAYYIVRLAYHHIRPLPRKHNVEVVGSFRVVFIIRRHAPARSFPFACLHVHRTAVAVIPVIVSIITVYRGLAVGPVQCRPNVIHRRKGLFRCNGRGRIQVKPAVRARSRS